MSDSADVVHQVDELISAVDALVATSTVAAIVSLARRLGAEAQLNSAVDALVTALGEIDRLLLGIRSPVQQLGALSGLLALTASLAAGLGRVVSATGEELAALGGADAIKALDEPFKRAAKVVQGGEAVLTVAPKVEDLDRVREAIGRLIKTLSSYKTTAAPPAQLGAAASAEVG